MSDTATERAFQFHLVEEPWLPCVRPDGEPVELGLREAVVRAHELREVFDPSPLVTISIHRLLLAILHRAVKGPRNVSAWSAIWERGAFEAAPIEAYLREWRERFDLFHPEWPFYQTAQAPAELAKSIAKLVPELASESNATLLFDHTLEALLTPAQAARALLACQNFSVGGMITPNPGDTGSKFTDASPLMGAAVSLVRGETLFETLALNLIRLDPQASAPYPPEGDDRPAWERAEPTRPADRAPDGYLDRLTWQSRRVRLLPERDAAGQTVIRRVVLMKGWQLPDAVRNGSAVCDPMVAYRANLDQRKIPAAWFALGFETDRALWRDSLVLTQTAEKNRRPDTLDWLNQLVDSYVLAEDFTTTLDMFGLDADQANVRFWRHERLPLPVAVLRDQEMVGRLRAALSYVEGIADRLERAVWVAARLTLFPDPEAKDATLGDKNTLVKARGGKAKTRVDEVVRGLAPQRGYWPRLDAPFSGLVEELAEERRTRERGDESYGHAAVERWREGVRRTARVALQEALAQLEGPPRALAAVARAEVWYGGTGRGAQRTAAEDEVTA